MWHRRMPWVLLLVAGLVIVVAGVATFATHDSSIPDPAYFESQIDEDIAACREELTNEWNAWNSGELGDTDSDYEEYLSEFESADAYVAEQCNPEYFGGYLIEPRFCLVSLYEPDVEFRQGCPDLADAEVFPRGAETITVDGTKYRTPLTVPSGMIPSTSLLLFAVAVILGASFIGAEYKSGAIETTLLWEPRRIRVLGSKLIVASLSAFAISVMLLCLLVVAMIPSAIWRGSTAGVDAEFWRGLLGVILLGGLAAAAIAAIALAVSVVTRNTVGGVALLLGYITVSPILTMVLLRGLRPFDLNENMTALATGSEVGRFVGSGNDIVVVYSHGVAGATMASGIYVAVAVAIATIVFVRRDLD